MIGYSKPFSSWEKVSTLCDSIVSARMSLDSINPVPLVQPIITPQTETWSPHDLDEKRLSRLSSPSLDSEWSPSPPNVPWSGDRGSRTCVGRQCMLSCRILFIRQPIKRRTLTNIIRCISSDRESIPSISIPGSGTAANGITTSTFRLSP